MKQRIVGRWHTAAWTLLVVSLAAAARAQDAPARQLTDAEQEEFLRTAKVVRTRGASKGITGTLRATLTNGTLTHEASIQTIDEEKPRFETPFGTEMNFRDTFKFNLAAYKLDRLLGLHMIPVTIERKHAGKTASFTWWVDDVQMDEGERMRRKVQPPDQQRWNCQMHIVRVFDQLIHNMDRNLGNLLIDKDWRIWMIDHGRSFRMLTSLKTPENLVRCDRRLLKALKDLDAETLKKEFDGWVRPMELKGLLARRDKIVEHFEKLGDAALYEYLGKQ